MMADTCCPGFWIYGRLAVTHDERLPRLLHRVMRRLFIVPLVRDVDAVLFIVLGLWRVGMSRKRCRDSFPGG
jgi:hypothetical protein